MSGRQTAPVIWPRRCLNGGAWHFKKYPEKISIFLHHHRAFSAPFSPHFCTNFDAVFLPQKSPGSDPPNYLALLSATRLNRHKKSPLPARGRIFDICRNDDKPAHKSKYNHIWIVISPNKISIFRIEIELHVWWCRRVSGYDISSSLLRRMARTMT